MANSHHTHVRGCAKEEAAIRLTRLDYRSQIAARYRAAAVNRTRMQARLYGQEGEN